MSSLTSLGVNKNKKGFAPKISKRKDRKERKSTTATTSSSAKAAAGPSLTTEPHVPSVARSVPNSVEQITTVKIQSTPKTVSSEEQASTSINTKYEPLTKEEMALNATAASRKRRRPSIKQASVSESPLPFHCRIVAGTPATIPASVGPPQPTNAPSPIAPIDRLDCNIERKTRGAPYVKVERMTPDAKKGVHRMNEEDTYRSTVGDINEEEDEENTEQEEDEQEFVRIRKESVVPKVDNDMPKIDLDDAVDYTDLLASGEDDDVDVDGDVHVERLMPVYIDVGEPVQDYLDSRKNKKAAAPKRIPPSRSSKAQVSSRLKDTRYIAQEDYTSDDSDNDDNYEEPSKPAKKIRIAALKTKGKSKEKEKKTTKKKASSSSKSSKKGNASGVSIGIGIPTVSSSTTIVPGESMNASEEEEEEFSDLDANGNRVVRTRRKKVKRGPKKQHRFAYRLVENMRTLDDITNDPAPSDNLEKPMSAFTKDIDGIVSKTFKEMESNRIAAKKKEEERGNLSEQELKALKEKEAEEERIAKEKRDAAKAQEEERRKKEMEGKVLAESSNALQVRLVNGEIVLDTDSLVIERTQGDANYGDDPMEVVEENSMTRRINSSTYGKKKQASRWDEVETALFYDCISQFGTDFEMIANMIPGRTRNQVRAKFNREEKIRPEKVTEYMITKRKPMDLEKYKEVAGVELEAVPDDFHEMQLV